MAPASSAASLTVTPVVKLASVTANPVEGGFSTYGAVTLSIPAQAGGAVVSLTSGDTSLVAIPASVTLPQGYTALSFTINTAPVTAATTVPDHRGLKRTNRYRLGQPQPSARYFARRVDGARNSRRPTGHNNGDAQQFPALDVRGGDQPDSGDTGTLQVPPAVIVPQGAYSASVVATSTVVSGRKALSLRRPITGAHSARRSSWIQSQP